MSTQDATVLEFIETYAAFMVEQGATKSLGQVIGYLLVCVPTRQPAQSLQDKLELSSGAVSQNLAVLQQIGLVKVSRESGSRQLFYEIDGDGWKRALKTRFAQLNQAVSIADKGLAEWPDSSRLVEMRSIYVEFIDEAERLIARLGL